MNGQGARRDRAPAPRCVPARVAAVTDRCHLCRGKGRRIVGVLVDPKLTAHATGFVPLESVSDQLISTLDARALAARGIGQLRHRQSPGVAGGYIANSCLHCHALIDRFRLEDLLTEHLARGGVHAQLDIGIALEVTLDDAKAGEP